MYLRSAAFTCVQRERGERVVDLLRDGEGAAEVQVLRQCGGDARILRTAQPAELRAGPARASSSTA